MHRSGTTMVAGLLERLGLFIGKRKDRNNEAVFFQKLNKWLLHQTGGSWQHPETLHELLENREYRTKVENYIQFLIKTPQAISFLGILGYIRYGNILTFAQPWGWKDPRNTFTLPIWLDIFPGAKVIHVYRHGVDVAASLKTRSEKIFRRATENFRKRKVVHMFFAKRWGFWDSVRCARLEGAFSLWEKYMSEARRNIEKMEPNAIEVQYENVLENPKQEVLKMVEFCNLNTYNGNLLDLVPKIDKSRAYAHQKDATLRAFAAQVDKRLANYGFKI